MVVSSINPFQINDNPKVIKLTPKTKTIDTNTNRVLSITANPSMMTANATIRYTHRVWICKFLIRKASVKSQTPPLTIANQNTTTIVVRSKSPNLGKKKIIPAKNSCPTAVKSNQSELWDLSCETI